MSVRVTLLIGGQPLEAVLDDNALATIAAVVADRNGHDSEPASPLMTVAEVATYLRTSRQAVDDMLSAGKLPRRKAGRRTLIARTDVETYIHKRRPR